MKKEKKTKEELITAIEKYIDYLTIENSKSNWKMLTLL